MVVVGGPLSTAAKIMDAIDGVSLASDVLVLGSLRIMEATDWTSDDTGILAAAVAVAASLVATAVVKLSLLGLSDAMDSMEDAAKGAAVTAGSTAMRDDSLLLCTRDSSLFDAGAHGKNGLIVFVVAVADAAMASRAGSSAAASAGDAMTRVSMAGICDSVPTASRVGVVVVVAAIVWVVVVAAEVVACCCAGG